MAGLVRGLNIFSVNRRSLLVSVLVLLLVLALFFIPELIEFEKSLLGGQSVSAPVKQAERISLTGVEKKTKESSSPYAKALALLESKATGVSKGAGDVLESGQQDQVEKHVGLGKDAFIVENWDDIRNNEVRRYLKGVSQDVDRILESLSPRYKATRYALFDFQNAIVFVLGDARRDMSPMEGLRYLEHAQFDVTKAMFRDRVSKEVYSDWAQLSMARLIGSGRTLRLNDRNDVKFDPKLYLTDVRIKLKAHNKSYVYVSGIVSGVGLEELMLYRNGVPVRDVGVGKAFDGASHRFRFKFPDATGIYTLKAKNRYGQDYTKNYVFVNQIRGYAPSPFEGPDLRNDSYFRLRAGKRRR